MPNDDEPRQEPDAGDTEGDAPPFEPDPRIVTYLERGRRPDAQQRFEKETKDRS
jgi:hypothetical protein